METKGKTKESKQQDKLRISIETQSQPTPEGSKDEGNKRGTGAPSEEKIAEGETEESAAEEDKAEGAEELL